MKFRTCKSETSDCRQSPGLLPWIFLVYVQEHCFDTRKELKDQCADISAKRNFVKSALSAVSAKLE